MRKKLILILGIIFGLVVLALSPAASNAEKQDVTATGFSLTSSASNNKAKFIELRKTPLTLSWPKRNEGCGGLVTEKKTMPWLADDNDVDSYVDTANVIALVTGNKINQSGNCTQHEGISGRIWDGGSATNIPWFTPATYSFGVKGTLAWGNATTIWDGTTTTSGHNCSVWDWGICTGHFSDYPQIWGSDHRFGRGTTATANDEKVDHYRDLYYAVKGSYPADYPKIAGESKWIVASSGTTLFRNEFSLSSSQKDNLSSIRIQMKTDDFSKIYINGVEIAENVGVSTDASGVYDLVLSETVNAEKYAEVKTTLDTSVMNVFAVQVSDKSRWTAIPLVIPADDYTQFTTNSNSVGLWYQVDFTLKQTLTMAVSPAGAGITSPAVGTHKYDADTSVPISATAGSGYVFDRWSDCSTATTSTTTVTMTTDKTCTANFVVTPPEEETGVIDPVVELVSPVPNAPDNTTAILSGNSTPLKAKITIPGYDSTSGGQVKVYITYFDMTELLASGTVVGSTFNSADTAIPASGVVEYSTASINDLIDSHVYQWFATGEVTGGSPKNTSGDTVQVGLVDSVEIWNFKYVSGSGTACVVSPATGNRPLSVEVSLVSNGVAPTGPFDINFGNGVTKEDVAMPYYYIYSSAGSYNVSVTDADAVAVCNADVTVSGSGEGGDGGEVTP